MSDKSRNYIIAISLIALGFFLIICGIRVPMMQKSWFVSPGVALIFIGLLICTKTRKDNKK